MIDFDVLWENAPCGHVVADSQGRIVRVNATLSRWLGHSPDALSGRQFPDLLTAGGRVRYETHLGPLLRLSGDLAGINVDMVSAHGAQLPMFLTATLTRNAGGGPERMHFVVVDATDRRAYERELLAQRRRAESEHQRVQVFAETLRRALLPPVLSPPAGLEAVDYYFTASADDVGGDFYDLFPLSRTTWGFFLGDVAGKGVEAAVLTGLTRYTLRAAAVFDDDPVAVLHNLNTVLSQEIRGVRNRFVTLIYGRLTRTDTGFRVELASGGHPAPLLLHADGSATYLESTGGQAVGLTAEPHFVASRFDLTPGDTLVMYTDGLTEASTGIGSRRYDDEGALLRFAQEHSPTTAADIVEAIHGLLNSLGSGVEDDTAVLALSVSRLGL
jgi:sigma-B regulation protein RsbU (phosphoserine phosphatase)